MVTQIRTESKKKIVRKPLSLLERKVLDNGTVYYQVLNGGGFKYDIWIHSNGRTTCQQAEDGEPCASTRSGHRCYHVQYALELQMLHEKAEEQERRAALSKVMPTNRVLYHDAPAANAHVCHGRHWNGNYCHYGAHYIGQ